MDYAFDHARLVGGHESKVLLLEVHGFLICFGNDNFIFYGDGKVQEVYLLRWFFKIQFQYMPNLLTSSLNSSDAGSSWSPIQIPIMPSINIKITAVCCQILG